MKLIRIAAGALAGLLLLPSSAALGQDASPEMSASPSLAPASSALAKAFPDEVGGILLSEHLQVISGPAAVADDPVASEPLLALTDSLGVSIEDVALASAFTFDDLDDERGILLVGVYVPGMDASTGRQLVLDLFTREAEEHTIDETVIADKTVTSLTPLDDAENVAYVYADGDMAWLVAAPSSDELEETLSKLP